MSKLRKYWLRDQALFNDGVALSLQQLPEPEQLERSK